MGKVEVDTADDIVNATLEGIATATVGMYVDEARADIVVARVYLFIKGYFITTERRYFALIEINVATEFFAILFIIYQSKDALSGSR